MICIENEAFTGCKVLFFKMTLNPIPIVFKDFRLVNNARREGFGKEKADGVEEKLFKKRDIRYIDHCSDWKCQQKVEGSDN